MINSIDEIKTKNNGECPYLQNREWHTNYFVAEKIDPIKYEKLLVDGWRRSSFIFYKNCCENCRECVPLRVDSHKFIPSKSQRRVIKKNRDISIKIERNHFSEQDLELFNNYSKAWHKSESVMELDEYLNFIYSAVSTINMRYYLDDKLIGISWIDVLKDSISSVYFAFDPVYSKRSLGTFSILKEIELCRNLQKRWLHLGFWVKDSKKMRYKVNFKPYQLAIDGNWE